MAEQTHGTWGQRLCIFKNDSCEVSILYLRKNQRCSWHQHQTKFNKFYVIAGSVTIKTQNGETALRSKSIPFITIPGELHEFRTPHMACILLEIMYVKYCPEDIERQLVGGQLHE